MPASPSLVHRLLRDPSFQTWASGAASPDVEQAWSAWIEGADVDPFTADPFSADVDAASASGAPSPAERQQAANAARHVIQHLPFHDQEVSDADLDRAWKRFQETRSNSGRLGSPPRRGPSRPPSPSRPPASGGRPARAPRRRQRLRGATRAGLGIAAVLLVAVALWAVLRPSTGAQVLSTRPGERATVQLPDGSEVVLNASSRLTYDPTAFADGRRQVRVDGEAFLTVARTPEASHPGFRVETPDGTVRVLGTRFSVAHRGGDTRVVLDEGRVAVDTRASDRDTTLHMEPGDLVEFDRETGRIERRRVNPRVYSSWTSGTLVFDNTPVAEVVDRIEATYDVEVVVEDPAVLERTVSGSVENDLSTLVNGLSQILDRPIDRRGDRVVIR